VAYIEFMRPRLAELRRVLKKTGSFYYRCDWHASHYVKTTLDQLFGENNFQSEIIWHRTTAKGLAFSGFPNNHDTILFYGGGGKITFNRPYNPYDLDDLDDKTERKYSLRDPDGRRYQLTDLTNPNPNRPNLTYEFLGVKKVWRWTKARMQEAYDAGMVVQPSHGAVPRYKRYLDEQEGRPIDTVWTDIPPLNSQAKERLGYPTQKPLALLDRIIRASSNPSDIVLDAFCGCGTALEAAEKLDRQWIGIDVSPTACRVVSKRLRDSCKLRQDEDLWRSGRGFIVQDMPKTEDQLRKLPPFEFENWAVIALNGLPNRAQVGDMGIDGRIYMPSPLKKGPQRETSLFESHWCPIQVKQKDKAGRPDIDQFEAAMMREQRTTGYFVSFDYTSDAWREIEGFRRRTGNRIIALTVSEILSGEAVRKIA
jgi:DNA modification methylase